ncbi:MAG: sugar-binding domain-containing protein, partial [bacterium]
MASTSAFAGGDTYARLLAHVSTLYYLDGRTQADIAQKLRVSRATVARLLSAAREAGIARIVVSPLRGMFVALETELEVRLALREVRIVASSLDGTPDATRRQIGVAAAADLARSMRAGQTVGLVGTELLASMVDAVVKAVDSGVRIVQGVGWGHAPSP